MNHVSPLLTSSSLPALPDNSQTNLLQYRVVTLLKQFPSGLTFSEIESKLQLKIDNNLRQKLLNNEHIIYIPDQQRLIFKFKYKIFSREDLFQYLQQSNVLTIDEDIRTSYPQIDEDIRVLRRDYKILYVLHASSKQPVVYLNPTPPPFELLPVPTLPNDIKVQWEMIKPTDFVQLRRELTKHKIPVSHLACNTVPQLGANTTNSSLFNEKNKRGDHARRLRAFRQRVDNPELAAIAEKLQLFDSATSIHGTTGSNTLSMIIDSSSTLPTSNNRITDSDDESRSRYLYHNVEAAPEEFERVVRVLYATSLLFYGDDVAIVLHMFLEQKVYREMDLVHALSLPQKQVSSILSRLMNHQLLLRTVCETKAAAALQRTFNVWCLDLDRAIDAINYRLLQMELTLCHEIDKLRDQVLYCPVCKHIYGTLDVGMLASPAPSVYQCNNCPQRTQLKIMDNSRQIQEKETLRAQMTTLLAPLKNMLRSLTTRSTSTSTSSNSCSPMECGTASLSSVSLQNSSSPAVLSTRNTVSSNNTTHAVGESQKRKVPGIKAARERRVGERQSANTTDTTSPPPLSLAPSISELTTTTGIATVNSPVSTIPSSVFVSFDTQPLFFGSDCDVYLPIITDWAVLQRERGVQLAKELLDSIADFDSIINARMFKYTITRHSLYIAYKRGFRAAEMLRLLRTLAQNPIPRSLYELINNEQAYIHYYRAVLVLENGNFYVQSPDKSVIAALLRDPRVREVATHPDQILLVLKTAPATHTSSASANSDTTQETNRHNSGPNEVPQYAFEVRPGNTEAVKKYSFDAGYPIIDEFDFAADRSLNIKVRVNLRSDADVRDYQKTSCYRIFWEGLCPATHVGGLVGHSGVLVLPCGAGKTLIGINIMTILKKTTIIFCQSILAVTQWKEQLHRFTTLDDKSVCRFTSLHTKKWDPHAPVLITTYPMFSKSNHSEEASKIIETVKAREWGLMILDEVHLTPANQFRKVTNTIRSHLKLGLTATMVREDDLIAELPFLVGPKLYELDIFTLRMRGHIAYVECHELHIPLTDVFAQAYSAAEDSEKRRLIYTINPNKTLVCASLIESHLSRSHKIMVFCDSLFALDWYAQLLKRPKVFGQIQTEERASILREFRSSSGGQCVLFSKVGDQSIDLPEADVVIQLALLDGSRMQEGQRIGRIQRPQERKERAYFYSLVSKDTEEMNYAAKRRNFLQEHGYTVGISENWTKYVKPGQRIDEEKQFELLDAIANYLEKRQTKKEDKTRALSTPEVDESGADGYCDESNNVSAQNGQPRDRKRKKLSTVHDEIRKKMRFLR
jgi:DNA excision repair protein ERCC-3